MEQNNLQPASLDGHEPRPISVALLGFEAIDEQSFRRFFQVVRPYQRRYFAATRSTDMESSDILMVNYDNPVALSEQAKILSKYPLTHVVAVSRGPLDPPPANHIRGMLFAARVLTVLDKISLAPPPKPAVDKPSDFGKPHEVVDKLKPDDQASDSVNLQTTDPAAPQEKGEAKPAASEQEAPTTTATSLTQAPQPKAIPSEPLKPDPVQVDATPYQVVVETIPIPPMPQPAAAAISSDGYRALVVDDSPAIQKSLEINLATLAQIGMIDFADSGEMALDKAQAMKYDLIFLDVMMPGIDGYETCTQLRKKPEYKKTPIIMVSGKTSPLDEVKGVMAGCTTYLTKPVQQEAFQKLSIRVLSWLEKQKNQQ